MLFFVFFNETGFSEVTLVLVFSFAGLSVTAASSAALCVRSWQMCSGTDVTRPNLEPWSEAFLKGPEKSHCPFLLPLHCLSLISIDNQQPHPEGPKKSLPLADWLAGFEPPSLLNPALHPSRPLFFITLLYHSSARQGHTQWAPIRSDFTGTDWEVPPRLLHCCPTAPQSLFTLSAQATERWRTERWEKRESTENIKHTTLKQTKHRPFKDQFDISSSVPGP